MEKRNTLSKINLSVDQIRNYVMLKCFREEESVKKCSIRLGIPCGLIYKIWNRQPVSLKSLVRILSLAGQWNHQSRAYILDSFRKEFLPQSGNWFNPVYDSGISPLRQPIPVAEIFKKLHQLSGKSQLDVSVETGYSRSFIQNIAADRGSRSPEALLALFFYYYEVTEDCPEALVHAFFSNFLSGVGYKMLHDAS